MGGPRVLILLAGAFLVPQFCLGALNDCAGVEGLEIPADGTKYILFILTSLQAMG